MIEIVKGSLEESKQSRKKLIASIRLQLETLKKVKKKQRTEEQINSIEIYKSEISLLLEINRIAPVKLENIYINYKIYAQFMKKLKGFQVTEKVIGDILVVSYRNKSSRGELSLCGIASKSTENFPVAAIRK